MQLQSHVFPVHTEDLPDLLTTWEASVRATHTFVSEADILFFRPLVGNALSEIPQLACVRTDGGQAVGFIAVADSKVEMLFLHPQIRGQGAGKQLLQHAIAEFGATALDVNEQNDQAVGFYMHMGCVVTGRSELDGTGKPYPILHLHLRDVKV